MDDLPARPCAQARPREKAAGQRRDAGAIRAEPARHRTGPATVVPAPARAMIRGPASPPRGHWSHPPRTDHRNRPTQRRPPMPPQPRDHPSGVQAPRERLLGQPPRHGAYIYERPPAPHDHPHPTAQLAPAEHDRPRARTALAEPYAVRPRIGGRRRSRAGPIAFPADPASTGPPPCRMPAMTRLRRTAAGINAGHVPMRVEDAAARPRPRGEEGP